MQGREGSSRDRTSRQRRAYDCKERRKNDGQLYTADVCDVYEYVINGYVSTYLRCPSVFFLSLENLP